MRSVSVVGVQFNVLCSYVGCFLLAMYSKTTSTNLDLTNTLIRWTFLLVNPSLAAVN